MNAIIFANIGVDGIHFCIIPNENDWTLERSPVYVVNPMMPDHYVEAIAKNFNDFINIVVSAKGAPLLECISYYGRNRFLGEIQGVSNNNFKIESSISALINTFPTKIIDDVYDCVRQVQAKMKLKKLQFSEAYYELTGQTR